VRIDRAPVGPGGPHEARTRGQARSSERRETDPYFFSSLNFLGVETRNPDAALPH
jgi:hypothetical protein